MNSYSAQQRAARFAALGDATRVQIVDLLADWDRTPAQVRERLGVSPSLLAHHLAVLERHDLIVRRRSEGDGRRHYLHLQREALPWVSAQDSALQTPVSVRRVLFICSGNTARSPLAAAIWARHSEVPVLSAGTQPGPAVSPKAVAVAAQAGLNIAGHVPRDVASVRAPGDMVLTLCDRANERLARTGEVVSGSAASPPSMHWSLPNPASEGTMAAYRRTAGELESRVAAFASRVRAV